VSDKTPPPAESSTSPSPREGLFDFRSTSAFTSRYLDTFYRDRPPTNDERAVLRFLVQHLRDLPTDQVAVEVGCGPTVHHAFPFAPYVAAIHMADYLPENLEEIERWKTQAAGAMDWSQYSRLVLELEGRATGTDDVQRREAAARDRIARLLPCDLQQELIFGTPITYPLVGAFYCTEEVGISMRAWERVMANLARAVAPGGRLYLACLRDTDRYLVGDAMYPCARIGEDDVRDILTALDFDMTRSVIEAAAVPDQEREGVVGVVLAAAIKRGDAPARQL
jgi:SAM-dependent methyltransferase